jgi:serine/threonine protein kinase
MIFFNNNTAVDYLNCFSFPFHLIMSKVIGNGAYGKVISIGKGKVSKQMELSLIDTKDEIDISGAVLREITFLNSIYHPLLLPIDTIQKLKNKTSNSCLDDLVSFEMEKFGVNIYEMAFKVSYQQRLNLVPDILYSTVRVLEDLKGLNLFHCDIKPHNILLNKDELKNQVRLIDFGSVKQYSELNDSPLCTYCFSSPEHLQKFTINSSSDVFSLGLTIQAFLMKDVEDKENIIKSYKRGDIIYEFLNSSHVENSELLKRCKTMLYLKPENRITYDKILEWPEIKNVAKKYGEDCHLWAFIKNNGYVENRWSQSKKIDLGMRELLIDWLYDNFQFKRFIKIFVHTVWIFDSYIDKIIEKNQSDIEPENMQLIISACLILASFMGEDIDINHVREICFDKYDNESIIDKVWEIFTVMDYRLFLDNFIDNLEQLKIPIKESIIRFIMRNGNFISKTAKQKILIYKKYMNLI